MYGFGKNERLIGEHPYRMILLDLAAAFACLAATFADLAATFACLAAALAHLMPAALAFEGLPYAHVQPRRWKAATATSL